MTHVCVCESQVFGQAANEEQTLPGLMSCKTEEGGESSMLPTAAVVLILISDLMCHRHDSYSTSNLAPAWPA